MSRFMDYSTNFTYFVRSEFLDSSREAEWHEWYNAVHIPKLLKVPGFISATRYQELGNPRRYLAAYEIESPSVMSSDAYTSVGGRWDMGWRDLVGDWRRAVYELHTKLPAGD